MTIRELIYLVAIADKKSFGRAAAACHVGQPTLSVQLKKLEDYLEVTLFERDNHHVSPTPIGEEVIAQARIALKALGEIRELARQAQDPMDGRVRLGVIPTLGPFLLPPLLPVLKQGFPRFRLVLREDLGVRLLDALRAFELDAALLSLPVGGVGLESLPLFREPFTLALPRGHPLMGKASIHREDLARHGLLLLGPGHCLRDQVRAYLGQVPAAQAEEVESSGLEMLRQLVAAGAGCTLLPVLAVPSHGVPGWSDAVANRTLAPPVPSRTIGMVWRRGYSRAPSILGLARFLHAHLPGAAEPLPLD